MWKSPFLWNLNSSPFLSPPAFVMRRTKEGFHLGFSQLGIWSSGLDEANMGIQATSMSSVQNHSIIPPYWLVSKAFPHWIITLPNMLGSIIPYNHQATRVLNTAQSCGTQTYATPTRDFRNVMCGFSNKDLDPSPIGTCCEHLQTLQWRPSWEEH